MNYSWLAMGLSIVLPALPLALATLLLKRAVRDEKPYWMALGASAMVFGLSSLWLMNSVRKLITMGQEGQSAALLHWQALNLTAGPFFSVSLLLLSGAFWARLAWAQRKSASK